MLIIRLFLFILSTLAVIPQAASREMLPQIWQREVIDENSPDKNLLAMASDSAGNIHLAYVKTTNKPFTGDDTSLYLASNNKGYWRHKKIDGQNRILNPKIYFDERGYKHLTYFYLESGKSNYFTVAHFSDLTDSSQAEWPHTVVLHGDTSVDEEGVLHVVQNNITEGGVYKGLIYAPYSEGIRLEDQQTVLEDGIALDEDVLKMILDEKGFLHVFASVASDSSDASCQLYVMTNRYGRWSNTPLSFSHRAFGGYNLSVDADKNGALHAVYNIEGALVYATNASGVWAYKTWNYDGRANSIAVDHQENIYIVFYDDADGKIKLLNKSSNDGEWTESEIGAGSANAVSIILTPLKIYVGYFLEDGKNNNKLMLASKYR